MRRLKCPKCGYDVAGHSLPMHLAGKRCPARQLYNKLIADGKFVANPNAGKVKDMAEALDLFDIDCEIWRTRTTTGNGSHPDSDMPSLGDHVWTTREGAGVIEAIYAVLNLLQLTFPEAARRLAKVPELIPRFETARILGARQADLYKILEPITYGKDRNGSDVKQFVDWAIKL